MFVFGVGILVKGSLVNPFFTVNIGSLSRWGVCALFDVIWRIKIPKKVRFFIWQVLLGCVNTFDRLVRRRTSLMGFLCCILCRKAEEDLDHLFWGC